MFELPSRKDVTKCVITKETIEKSLKPTLVTSAGAALDERRRARRRVGVASLHPAGLSRLLRSPVLQPDPAAPATAASGRFHIPTRDFEAVHLRPRAWASTLAVDEPSHELGHRDARPVGLAD